MLNIGIGGFRPAWRKGLTIRLAPRWRASGRALVFAAGLVAADTLSPAPAAAQEWHELYADGQRALRNGQTERAVSLLKRAIQKRPEPGLSVPTYGTNFEPKYFPYLRLAEAFLRLESYDEALGVLATSAKFGIEPAAERTDLETRAKTALDAKRPQPRVAAAPVPAPTPPPPPPQVVIPPAVVTESVKAAPSRDSPASSAPAPAPPAASPASPSRAAGPPARSSTTLEISSDPAGAQVFVDDLLIGRTDPQTGRIRLTSLAAGRHRIRVSLDGRDEVLREVDLGEKPVTVQVALTARPPAIEAPTSPAPPNGQSSSLRWLAILALVALVGLVPILWLRTGPRAEAAPEPGRPQTPRPLPASPPSVSGSNENLPLQFGDYLLVRRLGKGGMATVYEAERRGERVALKRPLAGYLDDARFLERFVREADLGRTLHHPNIIRIFDRGQVDGIPYFTMELIDGETLRDRIDRDGRLDSALATTITARVAEALDYAHHKGVIHRDLKPSNIMLDRSGTVKVMDYGIARAQHLAGVTTAGGFVGTPHYAAPEAADALTEPKSDVYSLGIVFFEMLTGTLPFRGDNAFALLHSHMTTPPPTPSTLNYAIPKELDRIVLDLLSKQPTTRPTAEDLLNRLNDYLEQAR